MGGLVLMMAVWPGMAQAMSVAQFLDKADAVKAKGILAIMSPDAGILKNEMAQVMTTYRADIAAARKAGGQPPSCPPPPGKSDLTGDDVIAAFHAIPKAAQARTSVKSAFYALMKTHYPCRS